MWTWLLRCPRQFQLLIPDPGPEMTGVGLPKSHSDPPLQTALAGDVTVQCLQHGKYSHHDGTFPAGPFPGFQVPLGKPRRTWLEPGALALLPTHLHRVLTGHLLYPGSSALCHHCHFGGHAERTWRKSRLTSVHFFCPTKRGNDPKFLV